MSEYELELYRIIGGMIREKRLNRGYTLEQVAEELNVVPKTLQRYETGERKIKINTVLELANILDFDYNNFMSEAKQRLATGDDVCMVKENSTNYYADKETLKIAQSFLEDKDLKMLFDLKQTAKADELMNYARFLKEQYDKENG